MLARARRELSDAVEQRQTSVDSAEASGIGSDAESAVERGPDKLQTG